nr:BrnA antitoxin family protein [Acaryochloris sp. IP29b_bin.137]
MQLDPDVMTWFQAKGVEYRTLINSVLRQYMEKNSNQQAS